MDKYKTIKILGDGAFGTVYKATNIKTNEVVAIKKMKQKYTNWNECVELREIKSLRKLNHTNIIKLKEVLLVSDQLYMIFQYLDYDLYQVYSKMKQEGKKFTQKQIKNMIFQIASGLAHMHKNGFFHRDMKPENLLMYNNAVKLCDFGLARQIRSRPPFTDYVSTRWYRAPQLLLRSTNYNSPVDIFALGCIMAELYTLVPLFAGTNQVDQLNKIVKILGTPDKNQWPEGYKLAQSKGYYFPQQNGVNLADIITQASPQAIDLIQSMLKYSSRKRPTATQILKHEYFKGVNVAVGQSSGKQVVFQQQPKGPKLDTSKQDKKIDIFRATKQKFKQTRKHDALDSNPFKMIDKNKLINNNSSVVNQADDIDSILKQLQDKNSKRKQTKLPFLATKDMFNPKKQDPNIVLRQSKTQLKHGEPYKFIQKEDWKHIKNYQDKNHFKPYLPSRQQQKPPIFMNKISRNKPPNQGAVQPPKFSYSFQPALNHLNNINNYKQLPSSKSINRGHMNLGGLGFLSLPKQIPVIKQKPQLMPLNPYKY